MSTNTDVPAEHDDAPSNDQETPTTGEQPPGEDQDPAARITALEADLAATRAQLLRTQIQARHGISDEDAQLFLTGADEETMNKQAEALASRKLKNRGPVVASQRNHPTGGTPSPTDPIRAQLAERGMVGG